MSAGAVGRFPAIEVKLKGVTAKTNPRAAGTRAGSTGRGRGRLPLVDLLHELDVEPEKSISSQAESISA
jgi:hypothetical protein